MEKGIGARTIPDAEPAGNQTLVFPSTRAAPLSFAALPLPGPIMPKSIVPTPPPGHEPAHKIYRALLDFLSEIPKTGERESGRPMERARAIANAAAAKAAVLSGGLALPPGPLGILTIIPDIVGIWKIQAQMVADIAGTFGQQACLTREQMLYCLFRHAAAQVVRDLIARVGERILVRKLPIHVLQRIVEKIGLRVTQRMVASAAARWLPIIGALGVGAYAFYDTAQVAKTAIDLFQKEIDIEVEITRQG